MRRAASDETCQRDLTHTNHIIILRSLLVLIECNARDRRIVVEQNDLEALFLEVLNGFGVYHDLIRVGIIEGRVGSNSIRGVPVIECVELIEKEW